MNFETEIAKTALLKDLPRMIGTGGNADYFVVFTDGTIQVGIKVDFVFSERVYTRIRIMKADGIDIYNMEDHVDLIGRELIGDHLAKDEIKGYAFQYSPKRASFMIKSKRNLQDYGEITTAKAYTETLANYLSDMTSIGNRIYEALAPIVKTTPELRKIILDVLQDFTTVYHPPAPKGYNAAVDADKPGQEKAAATVTDITKAKAKKEQDQPEASADETKGDPKKK